MTETVEFARNASIIAAMQAVAHFKSSQPLARALQNGQNHQRNADQMRNVG